MVVCETALALIYCFKHTLLVLWNYARLEALMKWVQAQESVRSFPDFSSSFGCSPRFEL